MTQAKGDPQGRRLAARRAQRLAEVGRLLRVAEALLEDVNFDTASCIDLCKQVAEQEKIELQRAYGHIEPRKRFKKKSVSHPLLGNPEVDLLFVDESGLSHVERHKDSSIFAIGAVSMGQPDVERYASRIDRVKLDFFGSTEFAFHEPDLRNHDGRYFFAGDKGKQRDFDAALAGVIHECNFNVFGAAVRKHVSARHISERGLDPYLPTDLYAVAIHILLERYIDSLASRRNRCMGRLTFESQGPREDAQHQLEYARVLLTGTQWVSASAFQQHLEAGAQFKPKGGSHPLELADMVARDLYEWVRGGCAGNPGRSDIFGPKIYCRGDGANGKFGVKVFPDSDIRDAIELHRATCGAMAN